MFEHETTAADVLTDAALGAIAGVAATAAMGPLTSHLSKHQPRTLGKSLPARRHSLAGSVVRYGFGTFWGAALGALSARWKPLPPGTGVALGIILWASMDEAALPALGLSGKPGESPRLAHPRGLAAHVLHGVVLDRGLALLRGALGR